MPLVDQPGFSQPHQLFDEIVEAFTAVGDGGEEQVKVGVRSETEGAQSVDVLDEFTEAEGLAADSDAGLEGFEAGDEWVVVREEGGGEDDLGGVARDFKQFVDAIALRQIDFEVG